MTRVLLCPTDFSAPAEEAIAYAITLAKAMGETRLELVHVHQPLLYVMSADVAPLLDPGVEDTIKEGLRDQLRDAVRRNSGYGVEVRGELLVGQVTPALIAHADAIEAFMIVLSTHGRSGLSRLMLGSIAERVVRAAKRPVCTVRASEARG